MCKVLLQIYQDCIKKYDITGDLNQLTGIKLTIAKLLLSCDNLIMNHYLSAFNNTPLTCTIISMRYNNQFWFSSFAFTSSKSASQIVLSGLILTGFIGLYAIHFPLGDHERPSFQSSSSVATLIGSPPFIGKLKI